MLMSLRLHRRRRRDGLGLVDRCLDVHIKIPTCSRSFIIAALEGSGSSLSMNLSYLEAGFSPVATLQYVHVIAAKINVR